MLLTADAFDARARAVQLLLFDVDGVLTDGGLSLDGADDESKRFFVRDGAALVWARREGLLIGLLSGRASPVTTRRARELGIELLVQDGPDKRRGFAKILEQSGLEAEQVAYMGDDLLDLPVLGRVGLAAAPADAVEDVRNRVHWMSDFGGGHGAVRQFIERILTARGQWDQLVEAYLR
jgi:3-deoxy-D-manno-octulosonate 8-phosphate phosphatase (KDO 8-P phosphatase)